MQPAASAPALLRGRALAVLLGVAVFFHAEGEAATRKAFLVLQHRDDSAVCREAVQRVRSE